MDSADEQEPLTHGQSVDASAAGKHEASSLLLRHVPQFAQSASGRLFLLAGACAMEATCYTLCVPFMTSHLNSTYDISISDAGFIFVSYTIGSVCSTPAVETITLLAGCSGAITAGVLVLGVSQLVFAFSATLPALFAARFVGGLSAGLIWSAVLTSCHRMSVRDNNMGVLFGTVLSAVSIGTMIGPALGGSLYRFGGWYVPLLLISAVCVLFALAIAFLLPEEVEVKAKHEPAGGGCCVIASWRLCSVLSIVMCGAMLFSSIDSVLPIHLQREYGHTSLQTAFIFFVISIFYGLAAPAFGGLADRTGKALHVSMLGMLGLACMLPVFALRLPQWALIPVAMLFGTSATAQLTPASTLLEQVAHKVVGDHPTLTYAVFNCAYVSGMAIGPGVLAALTDRLSFQLATLCLSAAALVISGAASCYVSTLNLSTPGPGAAGASDPGGAEGDDESLS